MIDRVAIDAAWNRIANMLDPVHGDAEADVLLRNRAVEQAGIAHALEHIDLINWTDKGAIEALGYGFARDELVWRRATEANFQARALQQLSHWWAVNPEDAPALRNVVVRHTFATSFAFGTPQHIVDTLGEPIHFVIIPIVYGELLMLASKALNTMLTGNEAADGWAAMRGGREIDESIVPSAMKQLFARILTDHTFHASDRGDNPVATLVARSTWFDFDENDRMPGALETHLSYAAVDFAIAHELGHRILHFLVPDMPDGPMLEEGADLVGIRLFGASWGWRDDIFDGCPLSEGGRVLLEPTWFFYSAQLLFILLSLLGQRTRAVKPEAPLAKVADKPAQHLALILDRWSRQQSVLSQYRDILAGFGAAATADHDATMNDLAMALETFTEAIPGWVQQIPEEDVRFAAGLHAI